MNINKFTQKSMEAVQRCEKLAYEYGNQEIDQEHFLYSLLTIEESLIAKLIDKMEINRDQFVSQTQQLIEKKPKVSGGQVYISKSLNEVLVSAEDEAKGYRESDGRTAGGRAAAGTPQAQLQGHAAQYRERADDRGGHRGADLHAVDTGAAGRGRVHDAVAV